MSINKLIYFLTFLTLISCNSNIKESSISKKNKTTLKKEEIIKKEIAKNESEEEKSLKEYYTELLKPKSDKFEGYEFKFGYAKYDEEKYGFENPGYLNVYKNGKVIFKDKFNGEGEVYVKSLGFHSLNGNKLIFTLNYGTPACDYKSYSRYYVIFSNDKINYLNDFWTFMGGDGYASRFYEHIFPEDSLGINNTLLIVEGLKFHEHDQEDLFDTTRIYFTNDKFKLSKPTNNLKKAK